MDRLKRCRILLILSAVLAIVFAALVFVPVVGDSKLLRIAALAGWISQVLQFYAMYSEIRKIKKGKE